MSHMKESRAELGINRYHHSCIRGNFAIFASWRATIFSQRTQRVQKQSQFDSPLPNPLHQEMERPFSKNHPKADGDSLAEAV
jgi:hypothetical protein